MINEKYTPKTINRDSFNKYILAKQFNYKDVFVDRSSDNIIVRDEFAKNLLDQGKISENIYGEYISKLAKIPFLVYNEDIYEEVLKLREDLPKLPSKKIEKQDFYIDFTEFEKSLKIDRVIFYLSDMGYIDFLLSDIKKYDGKEIIFIVKEKSSIKEELINTISGIKHEKIYENSDNYYVDFSSLKNINTENTILKAYGEDALLSIKDLKIKSFITVKPSSFYAKALTNLFANTGLCHIYVKENFNIYDYITIIEKSKATYYHLYLAYKKYGEIYSDIESLYIKYPNIFINFYDDGFNETPLESFNLENFSFNEFYKEKDVVINDFLEENNIKYIKEYIDMKTLEKIDIDYFAKEKKEAILVSGVIANKCKNAYVVDTNANPREYFGKLKSDKIMLASNFLFFSTAKIISLYNKTRPKKEQISECPSHIDYSFYKKENKVYETFPLYNKPCIARLDDGSFEIFTFDKVDGKVKINGYEINISHDDRVKLFRPMESFEDIKPDFEMKDSISYEKFVGENRYNILIVNDKIIAIKKGEIKLSPLGVVISLNEKEFLKLAKKINLKTECGVYYDVSNLTIEISIKKPFEKSFDWIYGGGISLIKNGMPVFTEDSINDFMKNEGWKTPLSMQTQESDVHNLSVHPRTAIGITYEGNLCILIFSGRTTVSKGANYLEMIKISKKLVPDIKHLMNVDGGASSVLALINKKELMELSLPSASECTVTGMIRNVKTMLLLEV